MARFSVMWRSKAKNKTVKPVPICSYGNLVLKVGRSPEKRFLVSSSTLSSASSVFKAMLSPRFKEGQPVPPGHRRIIPIHDDDPLAFELLLKLLHRKQRSFLRDIKPETFYDLAILVDKYLCSQAVGSQVKNYLIRTHDEWCGKEVMEVSACALLAGAAAAFGLHACFRTFTSCVARGSEGQLQNFLEEEDTFLGPRPLMLFESLKDCVLMGANSDDTLQKKLFAQGLCLTCARHGSPEMGTCRAHRD